MLEASLVATCSRSFLHHVVPSSYRRLLAFSRSALASGAAWQPATSPRKCSRPEWSCGRVGMRAQATSGFGDVSFQEARA